MLPAWSLPLLAALVSAVLTEAAIRYAQRKALLDRPERRRSHRIPTPRGGGIGIVVASLLAGVWLPPAEGADRLWPVAVGVGLASVAVIGWWDDHRPLPVLPKLLIHVIAAVLLVVALGIGNLAPEAHPGRAIGLWPIGMLAGLLLVVGIVASVNIHNFMDGINGLLAWQAVFVFGGLALLAAWRGDAAWPVAALAAAVAAFIPFNFPKARVFMGDVGSGALGFLVAVVLLSPASRDAFFIGLLLDSAFIVDAGATLLRRMLGGRRWYSAHREHLYQWLVRLGYSHARVVGLYALWNLCVALPCAILYVHWSDLLHAPSVQAGTLLAPVVPPIWLIPLVLMVGAVVWWRAKRWCLEHARRGGREHALA